MKIKVLSIREKTCVCNEMEGKHVEKASQNIKWKTGGRGGEGAGGSTGEEEEEREEEQEREEKDVRGRRSEVVIEMEIKRRRREGRQMEGRGRVREGDKD